MSDKNQLIELEKRLVYQERLVDELSSVVTDQWKSLNNISKKLDTLTKRFLDLEERSVSEAVIPPSSHK
ncbi:SlyX family protein [Bartonella phoceensis]|uniref:SlyX family protein n=1 Tax=Bartonella phoceensis TaxID=270249 RepID=UPI001ABB20D4|nr:SlyX family protein [Bartonella phoceensis]